MSRGTLAVVSVVALLLSIFTTCVGCVRQVEVKYVDPAADYDSLRAAEQRVYRLKAFCLDGKGSSGSAVDLGSGVVATAKHITEGRESCTYSLTDIYGEEHMAVFLTDSKGDDLAFLLSDTELPPIEIGTPARYLPVWAVGYPGQPGGRDQELTVSSGVVMGPVHPTGEIRISTPIYFGSSGGAVFDGRGRLIGITASLYVSMPLGSSSPIPYVASAYAVPSSRVQELLWSMTPKIVSSWLTLQALRMR